jgi:hypothetical protein
MITAAKSTVSGVIAHFDVLRRKDRWPFFWRISLEGAIIPMIVTVALSAAFHLPSRTDLQQFTFPKVFVWVVVLAPFFETLLLQALPVVIARRCGLRFWGQIIATLIPFAVLHFRSGIAAGICGGVVSGFYIAFTYVHWRQVSFRSALWMTSGMHAVHNLIVLVAALVVGEK